MKSIINPAFALILAAGCGNRSPGVKNQISSSFINYMENPKADTIYLGAGCFWCVEAVFQELQGVLSVTPGYMGGHKPNPSYEEVCTGLTGHAEVCRLIFDPSLITLDEILEVYWYTHDPTTPNRQGNDVGPQYRSVIFYTTEQQKEKALFYKNKLNQVGAFPSQVITEIVPAGPFYPAEDYHHNYYRLHSDQPYCQYVIKPKLEKFRKAFQHRLKN